MDIEQTARDERLAALRAAASAADAEGASPNCEVKYIAGKFCATMSTTGAKTASCARKCKSASYSWERRSFEQHRLRVREATPTVNVTAPERRSHVRYNAKRWQLEQERQAEIARKNFILFKRLTDIMSGKYRNKYPLTEKISKCIKTR